MRFIFSQIDNMMGIIKITILGHLREFTQWISRYYLVKWSLKMIKIAVDVSAMECKMIKITVISAADIGIFITDIIISVFGSSILIRMYIAQANYTTFIPQKLTDIKLYNLSTSRETIWCRTSSSILIQIGPNHYFNWWWLNIVWTLQRHTPLHQHSEDPWDLVGQHAHFSWIITSWLQVWHIYALLHKIRE